MVSPTKPAICSQDFSVSRKQKRNKPCLFFFFFTIGNKSGQGRGALNLPSFGGLSQKVQQSDMNQLRPNPGQNQFRPQQQQQQGPFPGRKGLVERSSLIRHSSQKSPNKPDPEFNRNVSNERGVSNAENQTFLKDVCL